MRSPRLFCTVLTALLAAFSCLNASAQFKEQAFSQQYNDDTAADKGAAGYNGTSDHWKNAFHGVVNGANSGNIAGTNNEEYRGMAAVRLVKNYVPAN